MTRLEVSAWVKYDDVRPGRDSDEMPAIVVTFYDEDRKPLGNRFIGPFRGTSPWREQREEIPRARRGAGSHPATRPVRSRGRHLL